MLSSKIIKKITACCCMAAVMLAASGCSDSKSYVSNSNEPKELKITYVKSPLNIPSIIDKNLQTVTHDVEEALLLGQRILVMQEGRIKIDQRIDMEYPRQQASLSFQQLRLQILSAIEN